ncbi:hypothetical protein SAMD00023353_6900130 [Rosellinia necatrix]|uniref:Lccl domain-containing protein n=1 Tax=Rosellinia necatrix TaxID=77044 RepID=A0A1W2TSX2_ROSNE|nr:hypothetical protein SAMD00023353_6900130 [Rosellinia necatrix]
MAAPASKHIGDLSGKWTLNKTLSDPTDPALALQGTGWLVRKGIGAATVGINVRQYTDEAGTVHIDIDMTASGLTGTREARTLDWTPREHKDWLFGRLHGRSRFATADEVAALVATPDAQARRDRWADDDFLAQDWIADADADAEGKGPNGEPLIIAHMDADAGWRATQIWGFQIIGGERRYVRNVVVAKGEKFESFKMIYDFVSE